MLYHAFKDKIHTSQETFHPSISLSCSDERVIQGRERNIPSNLKFSSAFYLTESWSHMKLHRPLTHSLRADTVEWFMFLLSVILGLIQLVERL